MVSKGLLIAQRNKQRERLLRNLDGIVGTVVETFLTCGKAGCRCHQGQKHGPYSLLTWSSGGRTRTRYIPSKKVEEVKRMTQRYRVARDALYQLGELNRRLVLEVE